MAPVLAKELRSVQNGFADNPERLADGFGLLSLTPINTTACANHVGPESHYLGKADHQASMTRPAINRRQFPQGLGAAALLSSGCGSVPRGADDSGTRQPNIILIMADDMGFSDIGCYGGEISTPNLDRLAEQGLRFTQFYNTARCCPTRASLLSGHYSHQAGIGHMITDRGVPSYQGYLNRECVTIAEALRPAGYTTLMSGKWHVGEQRPHWPTDRGFDRYYGLISGGSNYFKLDGARQMVVDDEPFTPAEAST